jgi:hypothetical protein
MRNWVRLLPQPLTQRGQFRQINKAKSNIHRDAFEFPDGNVVVLTHLCTGQRATVLQLPARAHVKVEVRQRHAAFMV